MKKIHTDFNSHIELIEGIHLDGKTDHPAIKFTLKNQEFNLFIDDEYQDLNLSQPILNLCLVLRELENYAFADDYLSRCV